MGGKGGRKGRGGGGERMGDMGRGGGEKRRKGGGGRRREEGAVGSEWMSRRECDWRKEGMWVATRDIHWLV